MPYLTGYIFILLCAVYAARMYVDIQRKWENLAQFIKYAIVVFGFLLPVLKNQLQ